MHQRRRPCRVRLLSAALGLMAAAATTSAALPVPQRASSPTPPRSPLRVAVDAAARASLPQVRISVRLEGRTVDCEGVALAALLRAAGAWAQAGAANDAQSSYVLVAAEQGQRVLYALAELDPALGGSQAILADRCDGKPLHPRDGPLRLIAADESQPRRWLRQVRSISVVLAP